MDLPQTATGWAKAELISNGVFFLMGALFLLVSIAMRQIGRPDMARA